jgi:hypothetical protein
VVYLSELQALHPIPRPSGNGPVAFGIGIANSFAGDTVSFIEHLEEQWG